MSIKSGTNLGVIGLQFLFMRTYVHYLERDTHLSTTWSVPDVAVGAPFNLRSTNVVPWLNKSLAISLCLLNLPDCCLGEVPRMMFGVAERGKDGVPGTEAGVESPLSLRTASANASASARR